MMACRNIAIVLLALLPNCLLADTPIRTMTVESPVTVATTGTGIVTITTSGEIKSIGAASLSVTTGATVPTSPSKMAGPLRVAITSPGKVKVSVPSPATLSLAGGVLTVNTPNNEPVAIIARQPTAKIDMEPVGNQFLPGFDIMVGSVTLNPYKIGAGTNGGFKLQSDNTETSFIVQVNYADRWAWNRSGTDKQEVDTDGIWHNCFHNSSKFKSIWDLDYVDFQGRGGYTFGQNATNASTIIGSGDLNIEFALGRQLFRRGSANNISAQSINLEVEVATVTDRQFSESHTSVILGLAYVTSFQGPLQAGTSNMTYLLFRGGIANSELPLFIGNGPTVAANNIGTPEFHRVWGGAMEMEARYQLSQGSYISAGARVFPNHVIAPWSLWIGYSATLDQLKNILVSPFKDSSSSSNK